MNITLIRKTYTKWISALALGLLGLSLPACRQHLRTGEISLAKAAPSRGSGTEDFSTPYLLDARGFNVSEFGRQLPVASTDLGLLGADEMKRLAQNLRARADQRLTELELKGQSQNSNLVAGLSMVKRKAGSLIQMLAEAAPTSMPASEANRIYFGLLEHRAFLDQAASVLKNIELNYNASPKTTQNPEFLLSFFGATLLRETHYENTYQTNQDAVYRCMSMRFRPEAIESQVNDFRKLIVHTPEELRPSLETRTKELCLLSADYLQNFLNLGMALGPDSYDPNRTPKRFHIPRVEFPTLPSRANQNSTPPPPPPGGGQPPPLKRQAKLEKAREELIRDPAGMSPAYLFAKLTRDGQKAKVLLDSIVADVNKGFEQFHYRQEELVRARYELVELSDFLKNLTVQDKFHRLTKPTKNGGSETYLTLELKTLFLRYADNLPSRISPSKLPRSLGDNGTGLALSGSVEARRASILVMARVQMEEPREASNYPLIFEPDYAAGHFVNQVDRFIWGPAPYNGKAIDLRFTVLQLRNLDNGVIESGLKGVTGSIALVNPEFAAISPAVNGLFSSILNAATKDQTEFDFSFTIPPPEGAGKGDTDALIAETGHYILIKKENRKRRGLESSASVKRDYYRDLIYNPRDARLYKRKFFSNPELNFTADNLFLDQSYAVIVVTDEYDSADNLGQLLREQVARRVGERRAAKIIPDEAEARDLLDVVKTSAGLLRQGTNVTTSALEALAGTLKQELWSPISDIRREFIVQTLSAHADATTLAALGSDPEKWKRAAIKTTASGALTLLDAPGPAQFLVPLPSSGMALSLFADIGGLDQANVYLEAEEPSGKIIPIATPGWWGNLSSDGLLTPTTDVTKPLAAGRFRVYARSRTNKTALAAREVVFVPRDFHLKSTLSGEGNVSVNEISPLPSGGPLAFTWYLQGDLQQVDVRTDDKSATTTDLRHIVANKVSISLKADAKAADLTIGVRPTQFIGVQDAPLEGQSGVERTSTIHLHKN